MGNTNEFSEHKVCYWLEPIAVKNTNWILFTAVSRPGLVMSSLAGSLSAAEDYIQKLTYLVKRYLPGYIIEQDREANSAAVQEFREYLQGKRQRFTLRYCPFGTDFQRKVWQELEKIPYGQTCSYADIAQRAECPQGQRAVGMANNKNPLGIIVPCHRVIGKKGDLTGYAGGLDIKRMLLELEKQAAGV